MAFLCESVSSTFMTLVMRCDISNPSSTHCSTRRSSADTSDSSILHKVCFYYEFTTERAVAATQLSTLKQVRVRMRKASRHTRAVEHDPRIR
jgi:hypothetical protein